MMCIIFEQKPVVNFVFKSAVIWGRCDRPARMRVEYATKPDFSNAITVRGPYALPVSDYTSRLQLTQLPENSNVYVRVTYRDLSNERVVSEACTGQFITAPDEQRNIRLEKLSTIENNKET